jgi:hypothetical protein
MWLARIFEGTLETNLSQGARIGVPSRSNTSPQFAFFDPWYPTGRCLRAQEARKSSVSFRVSVYRFLDLRYSSAAARSTTDCSMTASRYQTTDA